MKERSRTELLEELKMLRLQVAALEAENISLRKLDVVQTEAIGFREITDTVPEVFWMYDWTTERRPLLYVSPGYEKIWMQPTADLHLNSNSWMDNVHPDDREKVVRIFKELIETGEYDVQYQIVTAKRKIRWIHDRAWPIRDAEGKIVRVIRFSEDITHFKDTSYALEISEQKYRRYIDHSPEGIMVIDWEGKIIGCNASTCQLFGFAETVMLEKNLVEMVDPDYRDLGRLAFQTLRENGALNAELLFRRQSGRKIFVRISAARIEGWKYLCYCSDITERKEVELELLTQKHALDETAMVAIFDRKGTMTYSNEKLEETSGYAHKNLIGSHFKKLIVSDNRDFIFGKINKKVTTGKMWKGEILNERQDGTTYWVDTTIVPFLDRDDNPYQFLAIQLDVTDRKIFEEKIIEKNKELNTFIYKSSHDIRGPVASILGIAQIAEGEVTEEAAVQYLGMIRKSATRLDNIVRDLIAALKVIERELQPEILDFQDLVEDVKEKLSGMKGFERMKIEMLINGIQDFCSDGEVLGPMFENLIANAIEHQDPGKPKAKLEISIVKKWKGVEVTFADNGPGMPPEIRDRVFEMFFRGVNHHGGTGLGLYIVKSAVDRLKGEIKVESEPKKGTTFKVYLPEMKRR